MPLTRRRFLIGPASLLPWLPACSGRDETWLGFGGVAANGPSPADGWPLPGADPARFLHGVASGDPLADRVVLWTRVTPMLAESSIAVDWRVASDPGLREIVAAGTAGADASADYTVHVDVAGLSSGSTYYYQFRALGEVSPRGRTRTLPAGPTERMRLAVTSCANYPAGFFNAYRVLATADIDLVVHLGDYIYEYPNLALGDGAPIGRLPEPAREVVTLDDYRLRHAQYKRDPDLQELHRQHPWVAIWDDHDIANDSHRDGAQNHQPATEGEYVARKSNALRAYHEWMPMRAASEPEQAYRSFAGGDLFDLILLDTRLAGRDPQVDRCDAEALADPARHLLGPAQEEWLIAELARSRARGARWRLLGQQVMFAPLLQPSAGCVWSADQWDGYPASRRRLLDALAAREIGDVVILTGDAHTSWAMDVALDPFDPARYDPVSGRGSVAVELVTPAVTSPGDGLPVQAILDAHPHVKFADQTRQGYLLVDVAPERVCAEWRFVSSVRERSVGQELGAALQVRAGSAHLSAAEPPAPRERRPELAP